MSPAVPPTSYAGIGYKDIEISHVPANAPEATQVLVVALNRPGKFNAVTENLLNELEAAYRLFDQDERVRAIVLTGNGRAFCAGADLAIGFSGLLAYKETEESMTKFRDQGGRVALAISHCTKPTIVALNGSAAGVGLTLTLPACIRVAWADAKIGIPFSRRGLTLESCSAFYLPRLLGLSKAMHLATTGATYIASDPLVSGLFSKLLPTPQETVSHAIELALDIAENTSLSSTKLMRDMMLYCPETPEQTHVLDSRVFISVVGSKDNMEGVGSFMEKRKAKFSGSVDKENFPFWPWWSAESAEGTPRAKI
ncbi:ClpP/crotonase-like domain-containing protein [Ilyonectria robusta]|uniref:ClpP/crotonase-like domain-containing protein n=1 Tax=Ilyonectria robusta TaxID=1079257 RepID=UPI001E8E2349|nr:ClpP/crotonase-like domain-containing protein [Ilyonectria robusta]KAH8664756.1 ClpP/crotonase-like domain-containing protein [Ilyonectria robusta]